MSYLSFSQTEVQKISFIKFDYPDSLYQTTRTTINHGEVSIDLIQVKNLSPYNPLGFYCRAWLTISNKEKVIQSYYYPDLEPVGGQYGIFVPQNQPSNNFLFIVNVHDYDGELLIVDKKGNLTKTVGGFYFVTKDKKYLFSEYYSDIGGVAVIDLEKGNIVCQNLDLPNIDQWYNNNGQYYFTTELKDSLYIYDNINKHFVTKIARLIDFDKSKQIEFDFPLGNEKDCSCNNEKQKIKW